MPKSSKKLSEGSYTLSDTGKREKWETGAMRENAPGKGRFDLISPIFLKRLAIVMEKGAMKYADRNWEKGMPLHKYLDSALRHISQILEGKTDEDHAGQASFNLMAFIHTKEMIDRGILPDELDDMPNYEKTDDPEPQARTEG